MRAAALALLLFAAPAAAEACHDGLESWADERAELPSGAAVEEITGADRDRLVAWFYRGTSFGTEAARVFLVAHRNPARRIEQDAYIVDGEGCVIGRAYDLGARPAPAPKPSDS